MSDVEKYWAAISAKWGINITWHQLNPMQQMQVMQSINLLLGVLHEVSQTPS